MSSRNLYYLVYLNGRKYRVLGKAAVASVLGIDPHRVARLLRNGKCGLYANYPSGLGSFSPAVGDDGLPYGSAVVARCREPGFAPRAYPSKLACARDFGVTAKAVYSHLSRATPIRDAFGYLWDLEASAPIGDSPFAGGSGE